jgi:dihydroflavonol-4-reductase
LQRRLGTRGAKVPARRVPSLLVRLMALRDPGLRSVVRELNQRRVISAEKARRLLGWRPRPVEDSLVDCAESLFALGVV